MIRQTCAASLLMLVPIIPASAEQGFKSDWPACGTVEAYPQTAWQQAQPQNHGWDTAALSKAKAYFSGLESEGIMIVHKGHLIASWGNVDTPYLNASVRKSLLNSLVGQAVASGVLAAEATLADLDIQDIDPPLTEAERQATIGNLMMSRSGIYHSSAYEFGGWRDVRHQLLEEGFSAKPGETWLYNNWDFNALGHILEQRTAKKIGPLFKANVATPIGMQDFDTGDVSYARGDDLSEWVMGNASSIPAYLFKTSVRDLARYGLLYLACGTWENQIVIDREWVKTSITGTAIEDGTPESLKGFYSTLGSYGHLFWVEKPGRQNYFRSDYAITSPWYYGSGNRGHFLMVWPALDLVIAHQVATEGDAGLWSQLSRRLFGSPSISYGERWDLMLAILKAHPDFDSALKPIEPE